MIYTLLVMILLILLIVYRVIIGPTIWDRLLGLNLITAKLIMSIVLIALIKNQSMLLDIAIVYAVLGFIGVTFLSIYIQNKGE